MLKESEQTEGQKLLKQLREEYKRPQTPIPERADEELSDWGLWELAANHSIN